MTIYNCPSGIIATKEGLQRRAPPRSNFFHFQAVLDKKMFQIIGFCSKIRGWCPLSATAQGTWKSRSFVINSFLAFWRTCLEGNFEVIERHLTLTFH